MTQVTEGTAASKPPITPKIPYLAAHAPDGERTMLYRFYDEAGDLLYVGITDDPHVRWAAHSRKRGNPWWARVRVVHTEWHPTRAEAEAAEVVAIRREQPQYNVSHVLVQRRDRRLVSKYLHPMARERFGNQPFTYRDLSEQLRIPYGSIAVYGRPLVDQGLFEKVGTRNRSALFVAVEQTPAPQ